ncbi:MAG: methionine ABC transporter ATP-binding protein [Duodenibacillus sp.]|nr:methionine ABC transporter ATP-binding protein [Duodenibacillus sp.]
MIELQNITQRYVTPEGSEFFAVRDVSLSISDGEIFGIIGRSGAGKSTLVRCINFLNRPTSGTVTVDGQCLNDMAPAALRAMRRKIGMIFQHFNILSSRTVFENVALPLELAGVPSAKIRDKVEPLIELVGLTAHRNKYPAQLSGGQKQRVGIARALANDPTVLLCDEATSALDPETTVATLELLRKINRELGLTIVMITHQMDVVKQICDRVAVMDRGEVVELGNVLDIFRAPRHETTAAMIGNVMATTLAPSTLERIRAEVRKLPDPLNAHLLRLSFVGGEATCPVISSVSREFDIDFNIIQGQVDEVHGESFGTLTVLTSCSTAVFGDVVNYFRANHVSFEELTRHVL